MRAIVIDCEKVITSNLTRLLRRTGKAPKPMKGYCSALIIEAEGIQDLSLKPYGEDRVTYLNSKNFVKSIENWQYFSYNKKSNIACVTSTSRMNPVLVVKTLEEGLPSGLIIQISVHITSNKETLHKATPYLKLGFGDPSICKTEYTHSLCIYKDCNNPSSANTDTIEYVLSQAGKGPCTMSLRFTTDALRFLKQLSKTPSSRKGKDQRELGGLLTIKKIGKVFDIAVAKNSIYEGSEDGIEMYKGVFNFHTHPEDAYKRHNVDIGWPSSTDYKGFLIAWDELGTILHVVVSLEGYYILSLNPEWINHGSITDDLLDLVDTECCYNRKGKIQDYLQKVNNTEDEHGHKIFVVDYIPWGKDPTIFDISYPRSGKSCLFTDEIADKYKLFSDH
jgi:hypothetical protein